MEYVHMKRFPKRLAILAVLFLLASSLKAFISNAEELPEAPSFHACIEYSPQGYVVKGSFTEIPPDVSMIQPLYSLDGETYQACGAQWNLQWPGIDDTTAQEKRQNQTCLYSNQEPLKSYLDKKLDRFYLKLRIVLNNKATYETQEALIDRGGPQPVPEDLHPEAIFASSIAVREMRPLCRYGKYQITVSANASAEDIASFLPDTLPVEIQLTNDLQFTNGIIDCPVTWKPLSLPRLAAGESVTINDAAEEIVVPEGTLLNTPTGIFRLGKPLKLSDQYGWTDEVRLVLNVTAEDENPTGTLFAENDGLKMAFHLKPTGATAIWAYTLSKGETEWTEIPGLSLLNAVNTQPSTANSSYALVLDNTREPYQSYRAAVDAGETPEPFLVGLKIEGGTYDGRQLVLAWPDTYERPANLPNMDGSGGNEANAGADNKNDSTPEGQRPNLNQTLEDNNSVKDSLEGSPQNSKTPTRENQRQEPDNRFPHAFLNIPQLPSNTFSGKNPLEGNALTGITADTKDNARTATTMTNAKYDVQSDTLSDITYDIQTDLAANEPQTAQYAESALASSNQNESTDAKATSDQQEMPDRGAPDENHGTFLLLVASAAIIGILSILQKLQQKRRTLARH